MNCIEAFQQGARCGHSETWGKREYLTREDMRANAIDASASQSEMGYCERHAWRKGYEVGAFYAFTGVKLPTEFQYPVDRKPESWV